MAANIHTAIMRSPIATLFGSGAYQLAAAMNDSMNRRQPHQPFASQQLSETFPARCRVCTSPAVDIRLLVPLAKLRRRASNSRS